MSDWFNLHEGELFAEQTPLTVVAEAVGTPVYVYSKRTLSDHFLAYQRAMADQDHLICYAVKANSNIALLQLLARLGAGFDIVSEGELHRVLLAGADPQKVIYSGVGKTPAEMVAALKANILCFNVESEAELAVLSKVAVREGKIARISLRVNPDVDAKTHPYISTGLKDNKFGVDIKLAPAIYRRAAQLPGIEVIGVDCHIGSQLTEDAPFLEAIDRLLALIDALTDDGIVLHHIDIGGGLGVRYRDEQPPLPSDYLAKVRARLGGRNITLIAEPGRSIAANAGVLLTKVEYLKRTEHKNFAVVDAAMNDLIRPALYSAWMAIDPVQPRSAEPETWDIVGPVCETSDFLGKERSLALEAGDLLCVRSAGAYGFTMSSNYNSRPRAAEVLVEGDNFAVIRERETLEDLVRGERLLPETIPTCLES